MKLFAQITKVDEEKRLVYGEAASETVDKADEIMDYGKSKPHFQKWSDEIKADTDGKSLGNVRAMHGKVAAGKLTGIEFDDPNKRVLVCAKIVDDNEWKKVGEGVYTGFSIGGAYGDTAVEKMDGREVKRYTAIPNEVSLVDRPCIPTAKFFDVQKADGSLVKVEFKAPAEAEDVLINGTPEQVDEFAKMLKTNGMSLADAMAVLAKAAGAAPDVDAGAEGNNGAKAKAKAKPSEAVDNSKDKNRGDGDGAAKADGADCDGDDDAVKKDDAAMEMAAKVAAAKEFFKADPDVSKRTDEELVKLHETAEKVVAARTHFKDDAATLQKSDAEVLTLHKAWVDNAPLRKMIEDAVAAQTAPLQKALDAAKAEITKLAEQPAVPMVRLRSVSVAKIDDKAESDDKDAELAKLTAPVKDTAGEEHAAAGLIKGLHKLGGMPLTMPTHALQK